MEVLSSQRVANHILFGCRTAAFAVVGCLLAGNLLAAEEPEQPETSEQSVRISNLDALGELLTGQENQPPLPDGQLPPLPDSEEPAFKLTSTLPARKMTVRRDPDPRRFIGNDMDGKSIRTVQEELAANAVPNPQMDQPVFRSSVLPWCAEPPYGRYLFIPHEPLLFEDIPAERYGEVHYPGIQPVMSFVKFMGTIPMLPYKIEADNYAATHEGVLYATDHHGNLRPGIYEGAYFPDYYLGAPYPKTRMAASLLELATVAGIVVFLP
jgi:hypothetical protein